MIGTFIGALIALAALLMCGHANAALRQSYEYVTVAQAAGRPLVIKPNASRAKATEAGGRPATARKRPPVRRAACPLPMPRPIANTTVVPTVAPDLMPRLAPQVIERVVEVPGPERVVQVPGPERVVDKVRKVKHRWALSSEFPFLVREEVDADAR